MSAAHPHHRSSVPQATEELGSWGGGGVAITPLVPAQDLGACLLLQPPPQ